ncbi:MAG TPA: septum site-determining protein MinC [Chthonomonadaceae bacterium]|nr:septum site-determining protein MinC [Chthonomonadaceae bacterium]
MQTVELTTWRNGLLQEMLLTIPAAENWNDAGLRVEALLESAKVNASLAGAQLTIDLGLRSMAPGDLEWLIDRIRTQFGLLTVAVVSTDEKTRDIAKRLALNTYQMLPGGSRADSDPGTKNNALYLPQTVRSGQRIVHEGHLIIGGDVNSGGEVVAAGDIIVAGALRGLAHAGSGGDQSARIIAGVMRPNQLRIAGEIARSPEGAAPNAPRKPEVARIVNGTIHVTAV